MEEINYTPITPSNYVLHMEEIERLKRMEAISLPLKPEDTEYEILFNFDKKYKWIFKSETTLYFERLLQDLLG